MQLLQQPCMHESSIQCRAAREHCMGPVIHIYRQIPIYKLQWYVQYKTIIQFMSTQLGLAGSLASYLILFRIYIFRRETEIGKGDQFWLQKLVWQDQIFLLQAFVSWSQLESQSCLSARTYSQSLYRHPWLTIYIYVCQCACKSGLVCI